MNLQTARRRGLWSGYIVRMIGAGDGLVRYLCDWKAQPDQASTDVPDEAAYFFTLELARDAALFAGMMSMQKWVAVATAPQETAINGRVVSKFDFNRLPTTVEEVRLAELDLERNPVEMPASLKDPMRLLDEHLAVEIDPTLTTEQVRMCRDMAMAQTFGDLLGDEDDDLDDELEADSYALDFTRRERRIVAQQIDLLDATRAVLESERPGLPAMFPMRGGN